MARYIAIRKVNGNDVTNTIVQPASMEWELEDVSDPDAGRTADGLMHKKTIRQVVALSLSWNGLRTAQARAILSLFSVGSTGGNEYFTVEYLDPLSGGYSTKTFYVGNRTAPMYSAELDIWSNISFKIIQR